MRIQGSNVRSYGLKEFGFGFKVKGLRFGILRFRVYDFGCGE